MNPCFPNRVVTGSTLIALLALAAGRAVADDGGGWGGREPEASRFSARLTGFEETPSIISTGRGTLKLSIAADGTLGYVLTFSDLEADVVASHIHVGQRGVAGGVSAFLCGGGSKPACPAGGGTVTGTIVAADVVGPAAQGVQPGQLDRLVIAVRAGVAYANVHTTLHAGGEIRGQLVPGEHGRD